MTVIEQIQEKFPFLTRKQREVANYMLEDPERMSYVTLKEMSKDTAITEMTILKTCTVLGFANFSSMKYEFRKYAAMQLEQFRSQTSGYQVAALPAGEENEEALLREICENEVRIVTNHLNNLDPKQIFAAADLLLSADKVVLFGRGVAYNVASHVATLLPSMGKGAIAINSEIYDDVYGALPLLTKQSLVIVVAFPDYYRTTVKIAEYAHKHGIKVMAFTDSERSPICEFSDFNLFMPSHSRMFLNNIAMPMETVNLLATAMNIRLGTKSEQEIESVNRYNAFSDFEL